MTLSRNLGDCFDATRDPEKIAIIDLRDPDKPLEISYRRLDEECDAVARGLLEKGLKRGDRVAILSLNRFELIAAYLGTMRAGLVSVPVSFKLARETVDYIVSDADLRAVFFDRDRADLVPPELMGFGFDDGSYQALLDPGAFETVVPQGREIGSILYTSGSTGKPKGVLLSHESQRWSMETSEKLYGDRSHHRYIVGAPMFHMNATISVKNALAAHASFVLLPAFDAKVYARAIDRFKVTWLTSVPTMLALVARERDLIGIARFLLGHQCHHGVGAADAGAVGQGAGYFSRCCDQQ